MARARSHHPSDGRTPSILLPFPFHFFAALHPFWKWPPIRIPETLHQFAHPASPCQQLVHQRFHLSQVAPIPVGWNLAGGRPNCLFRHGLQPRQPRLERLPSADIPVHVIAVIHSPQRGILKPPFPRVKAISEVDEHCPIPPFPLALGKNRLPSVGVSGP